MSQLTDRDDAMIFRVQQALKVTFKTFRITSRRTAEYASFIVEPNWQFRVDRDQLEHLADYLSSQTAFNEEVDKLLDDCMALMTNI